ncbi:primosomal replication protein N [Thiohalobacter sp.]|uniref:primosomal replication protein N n=1 Tax=Thiohalobacter sp. TaxID=2025948 RepID=UPI0026218A22|nr:primosomal replication protein N [Thiohalobacter sp.]
MRNRTELEGWLVAPPEVRYTPAGIPIARFLLEHRSTQTEAAHPVEIRARMRVVAAGRALQDRLAGLETGSRLRVRGFLAQPSRRSGPVTIELHADCIERVAEQQDTESN